MKLFQTLYNEDGELMAPPIYVRNRSAIPGSPLTADAGWYHVHSDMSTTPQGRDRMLREFLEKMRQIPGYMTLKDTTSRAQIGSFVRYTYQVTYVIEDHDIAQEALRRAANGTVPPLMIQEMLLGMRR